MRSNIFNKKHYILVQDVKKSKIRPIFPFAILIASLIFYLSSKLAALPMLAFTSMIVLLGGLDFSIIYSFQKLIIPYLTLLLVLLLWIKFIEKRNFTSLGFKRYKYLAKLLRGMLLGFSIISISVISIIIFQGAKLELDSLFTVKSFLGFIFLLLGFMIEGFSKEILTRGWLLPVISRRHNVGLGIILSSIFYVGLHIFNENITLIAIINLFIFSIFASLYTLKTDSLWQICGLHGAWSFTQASIFGFNLMGSKIIGGSLFNIKAKGFDVISGGAYGVEGSLILTFVLIASVIYTYNKSTKEYTIKNKKKRLT